jgi:thiol-disulfide isomerase/thioredoxin
MSKKTIVILLIVLTVLAAVAFVFITKEDAAAPAVTDNSQTSSMNTAPKPSESADEPATAAAGAYVDYSSDVIASTEGTKVLFFHAPWCPQCRAIEADITPENIPANTTFIKVDYDTNQALRQQYGVTLQTTFVKVDDQGNLVEKYVAYDEPTFESVKANIL